MFEVRTFRSRCLLHLVLILLTLPFLFPLIAMVQGSLAGQGWRNYSIVLAVPQLPLFFRNSAIIAGGDIIIVYICSMLAGFGFAKLRIRGKEFFFWLLIICLTLPEAVLLTPLFVTVTKINLYNTYWAVILPLAALQIPFTALLARNFINGIPEAITDSARVDGAGPLRTFWNIVLPLTRPIAAAIIILTLIQGWNDYLLPLVFLQSPSTQSITLLPTFFVSQFSDDQTKVLAAGVITAIPEILVYLCLQRFFERGLTAGAIR